MGAMQTEPSCSRRRGARFPAGAWALVLLLGMPAVRAGAQSDEASLSLSGALRAAGSHSLAADRAALQVKTAMEGVKQARSSYFPLVSLTGGLYERDHEVVARFGTLSAPTTNKGYWSFEASVREVLWDFGRRSSGLRGAQKREEAVDAAGRAAVSGAQVAALNAYLQVLRLGERRVVVGERVRSLQDHLRVAQNLYKEGVVARNDLLETEVRLRDVQDQAAQLADQQEVARRSLNRLLGRDPGAGLDLPSHLPPPPPLRVSDETLQARALDGNPEVMALQRKLAAEKEAVALRQGDRKPVLFAEAMHTYQKNDYLVYDNANILFLGAQWDVYDGGARDSRIREAEIATELTTRDLTEAKRRVAIEVDQALRAYRQALREAATAGVNVKAAEENLRIVEDQYRAGIANSTDALDAEAVLAASRFSLVDRHYQAYAEQAAALSVAGEDLPTFYDTIGTRTPEKQP